MGNIPQKKSEEYGRIFEKWEIYPYKKMKKYGLYFKKVKYNRTRKERYRGIPLKLDLDKKAG